MIVAVADTHAVIWYLLLPLPAVAAVCWREMSLFEPFRTSRYLKYPSEIEMTFDRSRW